MLAENDPDVAVIVAEPTSTAFTVLGAVILATAGLLEIHVVVVLTSVVVPSEFIASALKTWVVPFVIRSATRVTISETGPAAATVAVAAGDVLPSQAAVTECAPAVV